MTREQYERAVRDLAATEQMIESERQSYIAEGLTPEEARIAVGQATLLYLRLKFDVAVCKRTGGVEAGAEIN